MKYELRKGDIYRSCDYVSCLPKHDIMVDILEAGFKLYIDGKRVSNQEAVELVDSTSPAKGSRKKSK